MIYKGPNQEYLEVADLSAERGDTLSEAGESELTLLWCTDDQNFLDIDDREYNLKKDQLIFLTEFHKLNAKHISSMRLIRFSRSFYCILDNDSEVGCKGILFFGGSQLPIIDLNEKDTDLLETVWKMLRLEMDSKDNLQLEMLQMMLKRMLNLCTRIYKDQSDLSVQTADDVHIVREFNFLVEQHFKERHSVNDYAELIGRSPKTLSNLFKKAGSKTPLQFIHERILLEARRLLRFTDKDVSEIGYDLGFTDIHSFSRFFKKKEGIAPLSYRNSAVRE